MMIRFCCLALSAALLLAQDKKIPSESAPPEVNTALRARISQFYQAHVDGKYRLADQVVAEESKDLFFAMAKPRYLGFEVVRINYLDEKFTTAEAVVNCQANWSIRGQNLKMNMPATSQWKLVDGQWFIVLTAPRERQTPFGTMHFPPPSDKDPNPPSGSVLPADPKVLAQKILESVRADKSELTLSSYQPSSGEVKITNGMQGQVTLSVDLGGGFAGLTYSIDKKELKAGEVATIKFICEPKDASPKPVLNARILIEPINRELPVRLVFAIPPELEKLIPKDARPNLDQ
jgi:hypothetical protein